MWDRGTHTSHCDAICLPHRFHNWLVSSHSKTCRNIFVLVNHEYTTKAFKFFAMPHLQRKMQDYIGNTTTQGVWEEETGFSWKKNGSRANQLSAPKWEVIQSFIQVWSFPFDTAKLTGNPRSQIDLPLWGKLNVEVRDEQAGNTIGTVKLFFFLWNMFGNFQRKTKRNLPDMWDTICAAKTGSLRIWKRHSSRREWMPTVICSEVR